MRTTVAPVTEGPAQETGGCAGVASPSFETVIGLEVHVELATVSKMFCRCSARFGGEPNAQVCPVCAALPGALPVPNRRAVEYAIKIGLALHCRIGDRTRFDRKNYFYPDLPKAYQISQFDRPLAQDGYLQVGGKRVRIRRVHMEEDAGKLLHAEAGGGSMVDLNRAGVPLVEIVTEPDLSSPEEARLFLQQLRTVLAYLDVSDLRLEEGSMRCDANLSLRPAGHSALGIRSEVKNLNSFRAVERALGFEEKRQERILAGGGRVVQETRHWNDPEGKTLSLRSKEEANDYRYFPEPDLLPLVVPPEWVEKVRAELPESPDERLARLRDEDGLSAYAAEFIVAAPEMAGFYDRCRTVYPHPKTIANWLMGEVSRLLNAGSGALTQGSVEPDGLAELLTLVDRGVLNGATAKTVLEEMFHSGERAAAIVTRKGLGQISDEDKLEAAVGEVLSANPRAVADYRGGKTGALGFLVGQVMKLTKGRGNPETVNRLLRGKLEGGD